MTGTKRPIYYRTPITENKDSGGTKVTYSDDQSDWGLDWANVRFTENREQVADQSRQGSSAEFEVHYRSSFSVTDKYLIRYSGLHYKILSIDDTDTKKERIYIKAKAVK